MSSYNLAAYDKGLIYAPDGSLLAVSHAKKNISKTRTIAAKIYSRASKNKKSKKIDSLDSDNNVQDNTSRIHLLVEKGGNHNRNILRLEGYTIIGLGYSIDYKIFFSLFKFVPFFLMDEVNFFW